MMRSVLSALMLVFCLAAGGLFAAGLVPGPLATPASAQERYAETLPLPRIIEIVNTRYMGE